MEPTEPRPSFTPDEDAAKPDQGPTPERIQELVAGYMQRAKELADPNVKAPGFEDMAGSMVAGRYIDMILCDLDGSAADPTTDNPDFVNYPGFSSADYSTLARAVEEAARQAGYIK